MLEAFTTTVLTTKRRKVVQNALIALVLCCINIYTMVRVEFNFYRPNSTTTTTTSSSTTASTSTGSNSNDPSEFFQQSRTTRSLVSNTNRLLRSTVLQEQYRNEFINTDSKKQQQQQLSSSSTTDATPLDVVITTTDVISTDDMTDLDAIQREQDERQYRTEQPRMLMGIFTTLEQVQQRQTYRLLIEQHNMKTNNNICSLYEYQRSFKLLRMRPVEETNNNNNNITIADPIRIIEECQVIYTFVMGTSNVMAPPMIVHNNATLETLLQNYNITSANIQTTMAIQQQNKESTNDHQEPDMTIFNIRENANQGKSQTWFYYARKLIQQFDTVDKYKIDYVMKTSVKTRFDLDRYFQFVENTLPPRPYNRRILASVFSDKELWAMTKHHREKTERFHYLHYSTLHIYPSGQMYLVSSDLVHKMVTLAAANSKLVLRKLEHYEDHDMGLLAQLGAILESTDLPLTYIMIPQGDVFWTMSDGLASNAGGAGAAAAIAPKL